MLIVLSLANWKLKIKPLYVINGILWCVLIIFNVIWLISNPVGMNLIICTIGIVIGDISAWYEFRCAKAFDKADEDCPVELSNGEGQNN